MSGFFLCELPVRISVNHTLKRDGELALKEKTVYEILVINHAVAQRRHPPKVAFHQPPRLSCVRSQNCCPQNCSAIPSDLGRGLSHLLFPSILQLSSPSPCYSFFIYILLTLFSRISGSERELVNLRLQFGRENRSDQTYTESRPL